MILYFTGTGNSRFIAEQLSSLLNDELVSINECLRSGETKEFISEKPYIFVAPIYACNLPRVFDEFIKNTKFDGNKNIYVVANAGENSSGAFYNVKKLFEDKNLTLKGFEEIKMPSNYIVMFNPSDSEESKTLLNKSLDKINTIAEKVMNNEEFSIDRKMGLSSKFASSKFVNNLFYNKFINDKGFYSTDECTGCTLCEKVCPLNNITMSENRPKWNGNCTHCVGCISVCPKRAIEYKNKTQGKNRYYLPENTKL